jgi:ubiquinone/menaquinone biosynthesis C-methylase UbiE
MNQTEKIHDRVQEAYTAAVKAPGTGCCSETSCCGGEVEQKGVAAKAAGYTAEQLASLPQDTVVNSFGCGNPVAFADVEEGETVLDLGSGAGIDLLLAAQRVGPSGRVIGVDMTDEMIDRARQAIASSGFGNIEVRKGIIEKLPVEDNSVDLVISNCVINLSPEKDKVFAEIHRVLKPGGRMRVSDIVVERLPRWMRSIPSVYESCVGGAVSEATYLGGLRDAGLEDAEVSERLVYDINQVANLVLSELPAWWKSAIKTLRLTGVVRWLARSVAGRVWSARFLARKAPVVGAGSAN